jgi:hypothetical protein
MLFSVVCFLIVFLFHNTFALDILITSVHYFIVISFDILMETWIVSQFFSHAIYLLSFLWGIFIALFCFVESLQIFVNMSIGMKKIFLVHRVVIKACNYPVFYKEKNMFLNKM